MPALHDIKKKEPREELFPKKEKILRRFTEP